MDCRGKAILYLSAAISYTLLQQARFSPNGDALYVVDIGVIGFEVAGAGPFPQPTQEPGLSGVSQSRELPFLAPHRTYRLCHQRQMGNRKYEGR